MKLSWIRSLVFFALMVVSIVGAVSWGRALVHKEIVPGKYHSAYTGYAYATESGEVANIQFYSDFEFAFECDGENITSAVNDLPPSAYFNQKQVVRCSRVVMMVGTPTMYSDTAMIGVDIYPFDNVFWMSVLVLVAFVLWGSLCFYFVE